MDKATGAASDRIRRNDEAVERPVNVSNGVACFGSDVIAEVLRALEIPYAALNPGASFRGLHDSLVNYLGNEEPTILLCVHEEHAVAIAHGYGKVTERAMAAIVHSNVGLMHATMAVFNAWCDRVPVLLIGATGPVDAAKRRPWIDWIHTARDQAALIRHYTKWDDQPASPAAAREALIRAHWLANTQPRGPVYITLDSALQEEALASTLPALDIARYTPQVEAGPTAEHVARMVDMLGSADRPVILMGRTGRSRQAWDNRIALAERLNAAVLVDHQTAAAFPTTHPLNKGAGIFTPSEEHARFVREADIILSLDWVDLGGLIHAACDGKASSGKIIHATLDYTIHNGWSMDHLTFPPVDLLIPAPPDRVVEALCEDFKIKSAKPSTARQIPAFTFGPSAATPRCADMVNALRLAIGKRPASLLGTTIAWHEDWWPLNDPMDWFGGIGGGGLGGGPGIAVGAALAIRATGRLPIAFMGDGDFLMGATAIWTAVHYRIPLLIVVGNNRSFFNDELHQERVAKMRDRPVENRWIGQKMIDPEIDLAQMARSEGAFGVGPIMSVGELADAFERALQALDQGHVVVVDVRVLPGYA